MLLSLLAMFSFNEIRLFLKCCRIRCIGHYQNRKGKRFTPL